MTISDAQGRRGANNSPAVAKKEKRDFQVVRVGLTFRPLDALDADDMTKLPTGKPLKVKVSRSRSLPQHRLYWQVLQLVCDNLEQAITPENLHDWVKLECGITSIVVLRSGRTVTLPGSIAFDKMEQADFNDFFAKATDLLVEHVLPGLNKATLLQEARKMLAPVDA